MGGVVYDKNPIIAIGGMCSSRKKVMHGRYPNKVLRISSHWVPRCVSPEWRADLSDAAGRRRDGAAYGCTKGEPCQLSAEPRSRVAWTRSCEPAG